MVALVFSLLAFPATAQDAPTVCVGADCPVEAAFRTALNDAGLSRIDGLTFSRDATGQLWVDIVSTDASGLDRIGPTSGARTTPIRGTASYVRTVPVGLTDIDTFGPIGAALVSGFMKYDGISGESGGGGGGGSSECVEVCVCTEDGVECWLEC